jgi:ketosteroid isomerase-like protein
MKKNIVLFLMMTILTLASSSLCFAHASDFSQTTMEVSQTDDSITQSNRNTVATAFDNWKNGTGNIGTLLAPDIKWTIVGNSYVSKTFTSKQELLDKVLIPFGARFTGEKAQRFAPTTIYGIYANGDTIIVLWDGKGIARDGKPYENSYAWFLKMKDGQAVEATAFFDSIAFNDLWSRVKPTK